ncbi:YugN family protein [Paenibacillus eucommiae]|uniref:YugN-like family protein n=1 Tax=Paenibacillus eucommiae TaxID=1355755 RepID=A0ABS4J0Z7_9BACL|nr:YugN family protein [Paenibacillus eucommiae]MBP1993463.1 hypothetical protein [Paenibacillus eucommiae]
MIALTSKLEQVREPFDTVRDHLYEDEFTLGGNWEYDHGYFDRYLDEAHKVWLRIPFQVITGRLDGDSDATDATIEIGAPFVLKHVYNEGLDKEAEPKVLGALIDQFQTPVDSDAKVEDHWVEEAVKVLNEVERKWQLH